MAQLIRDFSRRPITFCLLQIRNQSSYQRKKLFRHQSTNVGIRSNERRCLHIRYKTEPPKVSVTSQSNSDEDEIGLEDMDLAEVNATSTCVFERLDFLMEMMEVERAVKLIRKSAKINVIPSKETLTNLIQQVANLGEYEILIDLYRFIIDENLFSSQEFFDQVVQTYFQKKRVDEAVTILRMLYHRFRKYEEIDLLFTTLTLDIMRDFPNDFHLIESFVKDCINAELGQKNYLPLAGLWKCHMLNSNIDSAREIFNIGENTISEFIPAMVTTILIQKHPVSSNRKAVLLHLLSYKELPLEEEQWKSLLVQCLDELCRTSCWKELLETLDTTDIELDYSFLNSLILRMEKIENPDFDLILCMEKVSYLIKSAQMPQQF